MTKENKVSLILNLVIALCVLPCTVISIVAPAPVGGGMFVFKYFTVQSNFFAGVVGILFVIFHLLLKKQKVKGIPKVLYILKLIATVDLLLTFFTVLFFLAPFSPYGFKFLYTQANFFFHFLVPILAFVSFAFFENCKLNFKTTFLALTHMSLYCVFYMSVALTHIGPEGKPSLAYDWYGFAQFGVLGVIISIVVTFTFTYLSGLFIWWLNKKFGTKKSA